MQDKMPIYFKLNYMMNHKNKINVAISLLDVLVFWMK